MEGVDKEKVQRIVYEMSKGSKYFQNEERKEALMKHKIDHMRDRCAKLSSSDLSNYQKISEELRSSVYTETGLTCSAGVAANRLLAKICSDISSLMDRLFFKMTDQLS